MYGFFRIRLPALIASMTACGASAGGIARPLLVSFARVPGTVAGAVPGAGVVGAGADGSVGPAVPPDWAEAGEAPTPSVSRSTSKGSKIVKPVLERKPFPFVGLRG